ncbi:uncharacterized protein LOC110442294 [Mizuhopecten yessoensis]|uniref:uncharacterized protein LOC110442294 n=1 Tax=Mizuhopecten yessoensis TaxID=6573 RepID=UPI000B45A9B7|nr:uncharacterized protein LOC110442294 [Mizuhopecten yessoensis]
MTELLTGLEGVEAIIDDTLIYGKTQEEHDERLAKVPDRIRASGPKLNKDKCEFGKSKLEYFGHVVSGDGISTNPGRVEAIRGLDAPKDVTGLRRVVGMINYLGRFILDLSTIMRPMTDLLKSDIVWQWTPRQQDTLDKIKGMLTNTPTLMFYSVNKPTIIV